MSGLVLEEVEVSLLEEGVEVSCWGLDRDWGWSVEVEDVSLGLEEVVEVLDFAEDASSERVSLREVVKEDILSLLLPMGQARWRGGAYGSMSVCLMVTRMDRHSRERISEEFQKLVVVCERRNTLQEPQREIRIGPNSL